jgi:hypothetical protein
MCYSKLIVGVYLTLRRGSRCSVRDVHACYKPFILDWQYVELLAPPARDPLHVSRGLLAHFATRPEVKG